MNRSSMLKFTIAAVFAVILTTGTAVEINAQSKDSGNVRSSIAKVVVFNGTTVIPAAGATVSRNNDGIYGNISTSSLPPGSVVTLWWVFFNNPEYCAGATCAPPDLNNPLVNGSLQYGGGRIVGLDGRADFGGYFAVGDNSGYYRLPMFPNMPNPAPGYAARNAEVHLVIRNHGLASDDPMILHEQLTTFPGCSNMGPACTNVQAAIFK